MRRRRWRGVGVHWALLFLLAAVPHAAAGHGFSMSDRGALPGPADISEVRWETDGQATRIHISGTPGADRHALVLVGRVDQALDGHVRITSRNGSLDATAVGVEAEVDDSFASFAAVHWQPPLQGGTCVLVVAWVGDVEDVAPNQAADKLDDPAALWDHGAGCAHRSALDYGAQCGHPDIPAYCSPSGGWLVVPAVLAAMWIRRR